MKKPSSRIKLIAVEDMRMKISLVRIEANTNQPESRNSVLTVSDNPKYKKFLTRTERLLLRYQCCQLRTSC